MKKFFSTVIIGVADLDRTLNLWCYTFGFGLAQIIDGDTSALASLRKLNPGDIKKQALVHAPNQACGMLHLIEFNQPDKPIRKNAQSTDCCPKT